MKPLRSLCLLVLAPVIFCPVFNAAGQTLNPGNLPFGSQIVGTSSPAQISTLTNNQAGPLTISTITTAGDFVETSSCPIAPNTLSAGASCNILVYFVPTQRGPRNGTLSVADDGTNSPQTAELTGIGVSVTATIPPAPVSLIPPNLSFDSQLVTTTSAAQKVKLRNGQSVPLLISGIDITGDFAQTSNCPLFPNTLAVGSTCIISVTFTPTALGMRTGILTVTDNANNSPQTSSLSGTGSLSGLLTIYVTPTNPTLPAGDSQQLVATGIFPRGQAIDISNFVTWSSSATAVAQVSLVGLVQAIAPGVTTITASYGSVSGHSTMTVSSPVLTSILVTPTSPSVPVGAYQQFGAVLTYSDGTTRDATSEVSWASSANAVASINSSGLATAASVGSSSISASSGSIMGSTVLTVSQPQCVVQPAGLVGWWTGDGNTVDTAGNNSGHLQSNAAYGAGEVAQAFSFGGTGASVLVNSPVYSPTAGTVMFWFMPTGTGAITGSYAGGQNRAPGFSIDSGGNLNWEFGNLSEQSVGKVSPDQWYHAALTYSTSNSEVNVSVYLNGALVASAIASANASWNPQLTIGAYLNAQQSSFTGAVDEFAIFNQALNSQQIQQIYGAFSGGICKSTLQTITVTPTNASLAPGLSLQFDASGRYSDDTAHDVTTAVSWSSSVPSIATINSVGLATAVAVGQTTITAASGSIYNSATLTGMQAVLVSITVNPANPSLLVGGTQSFTATGIYSDNSQQDLTNTVTWASSNEAVATIDATGLATAWSIGSTSTSATLNSIAGSTTLTVTLSAPSLVSISVSPANPLVAIGQNQQFTAHGTYSDGSDQDLTNSLLWSSTQPDVATISNTGLAGGLTGGASTISAASGSIIGSTTLKVNPLPLISIAVTPASPAIALGTNQQFAATATYADGSTLDLTTSVNWSSSTTLIATINAAGLASSLSTGQSTIGAAAAGISGFTFLTVTSAALTLISVTPATPAIPLGTTAQFAATGTFTDGTVQDVTTSVQWGSSNGSIATVSNAGGTQGLATSVASGMTTIFAGSGAISGFTVLTVSHAALASIIVTPATPSIALGTTQQFAATGTFTDGNQQDLTNSATWFSGSTTVATLSPTGVATSGSVGAALVTAALAAIQGSTLLTVTPAAVVSLTVNPATTAVPVGINPSFTAQGTFTDATIQDVTDSAHWSSSVPAVATVSNSPGTNGLATSLGSGGTMITATLMSVPGSANLTVTSAVLATIEISPVAPVVALGGTTQFTATGIYTDGTSANVTSNVTWASSTPSVATVSNLAGSQGLATGIGAGASRIFAASGSLETSTTLTVQDQLVSINVTPRNILIAPGNNQQLTAIGTYASGLQDDITNTVLWASSNSAVATIGSGGLAMGFTVGQATITATLSSVSSSASLGVTAIQHVVVIFQENRTPDNLFQDPNLIANGADIVSSGINSQGQAIPLQSGALATVYDLNHSHGAFLQMYDNGKMDGADKVNVVCEKPGPGCPPPNPQFAYVRATDVAPYFQLAETYAFADRMFQTNQGPSFPAHQFIISGTSAPTATSSLFAAENTKPGSLGAGCTAPSNVTVAMIDPNGDESTKQYPCFEHSNLTDLLDAQSFSWRYYAPSAGSIWTGPNAIQHIRFGQDWNYVVIPQTRVLTDIAGGDLAAVSWVIPSGQASDHAGGSDGSGPSWVASIVNAVGNSQYWANTAVFITWDDWGGWYDHVAPPIINSYEYGFRVPLIVVSPYAKPGYISHVTHDFGSILKFIEETYNLPSLGYADAPADDLSDCFDFSQMPMPFQKINAPLGPEHFLNDTRSPTDPDDD